MKFFLIVLASFITFLLTACAYHDAPQPTTANVNLNTVGNNPTMYVAGLMGPAAVVWKNGVADTLDQGVIRSVFVSGNDVYAAGWKRTPLKVINNTFEGGDIAIATYWKNGVPVLLSDTSLNSYVHSIFVADGHVYAVGHSQARAGQSGVPFSAKYWKDGETITLLTPNASESYANGIYVSGSDVYVTGWIRAGNHRFAAAYWKNGVPTYLTDGTIDCTATSIVVSGDDIYVAGTVGFQDMNIEGGFLFGPGAKIYATYWKNNQAVTLSTTGSYASSIFVNGTDVYVAGAIGNASSAIVSTPFGDMSGNLATYWKNGVQINLNNDNQISLANAISVTQNGDVYLGGTINNQAVYWVNGARTYLPNNSSRIPTHNSVNGSNSYLYSVF
jgi:hypothetical protein